MKKNRLGASPLVVTDICMGTMTFGSFADEKESLRILDAAFERGVNFLDTAEIYPVPPEEKWVHRTEEIVGRWLKQRHRDSVIVASKVAGPAHGWFVPPLRSGMTALDAHQIRTAIEGSLRRLQTDYIDLYQTHWPDPGANASTHQEVMEALDDLKREGKIRVAGCSNETPWGLMKALHQSEMNGLIRYETIQNNFSILNRRFEDSLAEVCRKENVSLLPYSPLAGGVATGKYNVEPPPENARFSRYAKEGVRQQKQRNRFLNEKTLDTTAELMTLAAELNMSVTTLAVAWSKQHDFVASTIIGASSADQLEDSLKAADVVLADETLKRIDEITGRILYPMG